MSPTSSPSTPPPPTMKSEAEPSDAVQRQSSQSGASSGDSNITLWQFLLELLVHGDHPELIKWTAREGEFKLVDAEAVARLWGQRKAKPHMNYDKLSRALRYYYEKNIIKKVIGQKFVYRFVTNPENVTAEILGYTASLGTVRSLGTNSRRAETGTFCKKEEDYEPQMCNNMPFSTPPSSYPALNLMNAMNTPSTAHSISTPSPTDSTCSPGSVGSSTGPTTVLPAHSSPGPSSRPESTHNEETSPATVSSRKRTAGSPRVSSSASTSTNEAPPSRRSKPDPLNLSAASNFPIITPFSAASNFSPLMLLQPNSPLLQPAINHFYALASASLASAGLYGPQMSPLFAASPFRSPLTTPKAGATATSQPQVFQFPPTSSFNSTLINPFSSLISPMAPFMMSNTGSNQFKYPSSDSLKTPTVPLKMPTL
ncbi:unnamed protein product [Caenorhabditis auriculariae]|uniref:ETS domain-containing protein n=1 Tax=Caenorhabditis auriculariae TaxID=2777116 RepID=A0A8S1H8C4_9PELO|nr:unnamed protein product [Caenorhabditis auriculariae]